MTGRAALSHNATDYPPRLVLKLRLNVGDLAIINNHRVLHGRDAFNGYRNMVRALCAEKQDRRAYICLFVVFNPWPGRLLYRHGRLSQQVSRAQLGHRDIGRSAGWLKGLQVPFWS